MSDTRGSSLETEERLVAELERVGVRYLSRQTDLQARRVRAPSRLLADLVQQPSSRVRAASIALLLAHPSYAQHIPAALERLAPNPALTLKFFYTAAVALQRQYAGCLQSHIGPGWRWLPDLFSAELGLPPSTPDAQLKALARHHRQATGVTLNWEGTYDSAARNLLRRWEMEKKWRS